MEVRQNIFIGPYTTFKTGGRAEFFARLKDVSEISSLVSFAKENNLPVFVLGGGSNIIVSDDDLHALFIKNELLGKEIVSETDHDVLVSVFSGEDWDDFVFFSVERGFSGIEALSAIPGTVGGAPIQNIGAYGCEVKDVIDSVEAYDIEREEYIIFSNEECLFSYRDSIFKKHPNRFIVTKVVFRLSKNKKAVIPDYPGVKEALQKDDPSIVQIRNAIKGIRAKKLPDPKIIPNVGSFFKNPMIPTTAFDMLKKEFPNIKYFPVDEMAVKIPAGWLIEEAGLKGKSFGKVGIYEYNALVLVNNGQAGFYNVLKAAESIRMLVKERFGIMLEIEPNLVYFG